MSFKKVILLASGNGSNAIAILNHFKLSKTVQVSAIITNNQQAGILQNAKPYKVPTFYLPNTEWTNSNATIFLQNLNPDLIVLAGFLRKISPSLIQAFPNKIINIHPALLPKFGGKGMYGMHVHTAVKEANETQTGPTVHYVTENYDEGNIIAQKIIPINQSDTSQEIAANVLKAEHLLYPQVIEQLLS